MDNNKIILSNLKTYSNIERLVKIQEELAKNKTIQDAMANNIKSESYTASNPII